MHIHKTKKLIKSALYAAIIACAAGAATGTLAWYSYQKDVEIALTGATIKADKEIQIGLRSPIGEIEEFEKKYKLEVDKEETVKYNYNDGESYVVYWIHGNYVSEILHDFQICLGSAVTRLYPISAGKYRANMPENPNFVDADNQSHDDFNGFEWNGFKHGPSTLESEWGWSRLVQPGDYRNYFYLPLAFRAIKEEKDENGQIQYSPNEEIFISQFKTTDLDKEDTDTIDLGKAIRCKVDYPAHAPDFNGNTNNFIFDPNQNADYELAVGGRLDLRNTVYYDWNFYSSDKKQIAYGQWDELKYNTDLTPDRPGENDEDNRLTFDKCTTFLANDYPGGRAIDMDKSTPSKCEIKGKSAAVATDLEDVNANAITTCGSYQYYGFVDLSIYLEGWDPNVINASSGRQFKVDLQFSIK